MIYEYRCDNCGDFELHLRVEDVQQEQFCPHCNRKATKLISSNVTVSDGKGYGWNIGKPCHSFAKTFIPRNKHDFKERCKREGCTPVS